MPAEVVNLPALVYLSLTTCPGYVPRGRKIAWCEVCGTGFYEGCDDD